VALVGEAAPASAWTGWREVGPAGGTTWGTPAAVGNEVFVRGTNNHIYGNRRTGSSSWAGWYELPTGGTTTDAPAAVALPDGGVYVFVQGTDDFRQLWGNRRIGPPAASGPGTWTGWHQLGCGLSNVVGSAPEAVYVHQKQVDVYVKSDDYGIFELEVDYSSGTSYSCWREVPNGTTYAPPGAAHIPATSTNDGVTYLVVEGTDPDNEIWFNTRDVTPSGYRAPWEDWRTLPGHGHTNKAPAVLWDNGRIETAVLGTDRYPYIRRGNSWEQVGGRLSYSAPGLARTSWGLCMYLRGTDDRIYYNCE
jgi:hypothetical protein